MFSIGRVRDAALARRSQRKSETGDGAGSCLCLAPHSPSSSLKTSLACPARPATLGVTCPRNLTSRPAGPAERGSAWGIRAEARSRCDHSDAVRLARHTRQQLRRVGSGNAAASVGQAKRRLTRPIENTNSGLRWHQGEIEHASIGAVLLRCLSRSSVVFAPTEEKARFLRQLTGRTFIVLEDLKAPSRHAIRSFLSCHHPCHSVLDLRCALRSAGGLAKFVEYLDYKLQFNNLCPPGTEQCGEAVVESASGTGSDTAVATGSAPVPGRC